MTSLADYLIVGMFVVVALIIVYVINVLRKEKHRRKIQNHYHEANMVQSGMR